MTGTDDVLRGARSAYARRDWAQYLPGQPYHTTCKQWPAGE